MAGRSWLRELDDLLRGSKTQPALLAQGTEHLNLGVHVGISVVLGLIYGASMGLYAVLSRTPPVHEQLLASAVKLPALFFLTLAVSFPSLYVFSAMLGTRLSPLAALRVIVCAITVNLAVLASFAPITAFFTLTTTSYPFMKLLNVVFLAISGMIGLGFLMKVLSRLEEAYAALDAPKARQAGGEQTGGTAGIGKRTTRADADQTEGAVARRLFRVWLIVYALVGAQMGWILRPFIGSPDLPFTWFRQRGGNVFVDVLRTVAEMLGS